MCFRPSYLILCIQDELEKVQKCKARFPARNYNYNTKSMPGITEIPKKRRKDNRLNDSTVKSVLSSHLKINKTKVLHVMVNGNLMKVESIAECSLWSILQYF